MKKAIGRAISKSLQKKITGGKLDAGGGGECPGTGTANYYNTCGSNGNNTGLVCCRGVSGHAVANGVSCMQPWGLELTVYCSPPAN